MRLEKEKLLQRAQQESSKRAAAERADLDAAIEKQRSDQRTARFREVFVLVVAALVLYVWLGSKGWGDAARMAVAGALIGVAAEHVHYIWERTDPRSYGVSDWVATALFWGPLGGGIGAVVGAIY